MYPFTLPPLLKGGTERLRWTEYETLLDKEKTSRLTAEEERRLATLRGEADVLMFRRSYAAVLLKRRGYHLPTLQELLSSQ
ncbi:MAG: hypothetical protein GY801_16340 [bacterium]|nr:hypothetical protein [bacterium]